MRFFSRQYDFAQLKLIFSYIESISNYSDTLDLEPYEAALRMACNLPSAMAKQATNLEGNAFGFD